MSLKTSQLNELPDQILRRGILYIGRETYRIGEFEIYYHSTEFPDPYVHSDPLQQEFGKVYFHRFKNGSYKGGTRKGMDLTLGQNGYSLSLLIRTIQHISSGQIITGPCNVVDHILQQVGYPSLSELILGAGGDISYLEMNPYLYLEISELCVKSDIWSGSRHGLSDKYPQFQNVAWRYVSDLVKTKVKNHTTLRK